MLDDFFYEGLSIGLSFLVYTGSPGGLWVVMEFGKGSAGALSLWYIWGLGCSRARGIRELRLLTRTCVP